MNKFKLENDQELLNILMSDQALEQNSLYKPGDYWLKYSRRIYEEILRSGIENFRSKVNIGKGYADVISKNPFELIVDPHSIKEKILKKIPNLPIIKRYVSDIYLRWIESVFSQMFSYRSKYYSAIYGSIVRSFANRLKEIDYRIGNPNNFVHFEDQIIGLSYFKAIIRMSAFEKKVNLSQCHTLFEIGGGFGATTDLIIRLYPNIKKVVYLDIPPNLYIGTQYLKSIYGNSAVRDYKEIRNMTEIGFVEKSDKLEILTLAPWQLPKLQSQIDIFYNSESFQEMPLAIIQNYSKHINRLMNNRFRNVCLWFYEHTNVANTISPDLVKAELEKHLNLNVKEFKPEFVTYDRSVWMYGTSEEVN
ncbi:putative sugar O-methyltransferase [Leptospira noguchii]|uniref:putative sugar O-methyltransferase n=1 Tax=Leptospira noguchii TaxID=28182 RepID=UPI0003286E3A|nr:putative sugar O-methyltransferase [Leptospira noguchii]EMS85313.1 putative sugar O-methyltransferase [Leptospira noguchii str. Cascata]